MDSVICNKRDECLVFDCPHYHFHKQEYECTLVNRSFQCLNSICETKIKIERKNKLNKINLNDDM